MCGAQFKGRWPQGQSLGAFAIHSVLTSTAYLPANELAVLLSRQERQAETFSSCMWITALDDACGARGGEQNPAGKISLPLSSSFVFLDPWCTHYRTHPCAVNEVLTSTRAYTCCHGNTQLTISVNPTTGLIFSHGTRTPHSSLFLDDISSVQKGMVLYLLPSRCLERGAHQLYWLLLVLMFSKSFQWKHKASKQNSLTPALSSFIADNFIRCQEQNQKCRHKSW